MALLMLRKSLGYKTRRSRYSLPLKRGAVELNVVQANIIFGGPFEEDRYKQVIYQCGLERDISLFDAGDETEVGEKGVTLSGGQKARVTLARHVMTVVPSVTMC